MKAHPRRWANEMPERAAVVFPTTGEILTYGALEIQANRCAHLFRKLGLRRGDHVAMLVENHPSFFELAWAAHNSGLYYTFISWRFRSDEVGYIIRNCEAKVLFFTAQQSTLAESLRAELSGVTFMAINGGAPWAEQYPSLLAGCPDIPVDDESRGSDMLYSSGSTGRPKGVKQALPTQSIDGLSRLFQVYADEHGWAPDTVYMMPAPLYHAGPLRFAMAMQHVGATLIVMDKFDARTSLEIVQQYRVTHAHWVPTMIVRLLKLPAAEREAFDISSIRVVVHGAAPISPEVKYAALEWMGPILEESYGGTEGNGLTMITSKEWLEHPGSVGRPYVGKIHILDDHGKELPVGETGTIWFSDGPQFAYHNDPERTEKAYDTEGRSSLGDVGHVDAEGYVYITDRKNNMIISGAVNVYPQEAENRLIAHPEVADACAFGVPDDDMGEVLHAVVQLLDPEAACPEMEARLGVWCRETMATIKCPRTIAFSKQLPRHDTGKIYTRLLKEEWLTQHDK